MSVSIREVDYDASSDILYLGFVANGKSNSYGDEPVDGIVVFADCDTDEHKGLLVFDPKLHPAERMRDLHNLGYNIDLLPYLN